jgi:hypothetical protein
MSTNDGFDGSAAWLLDENMIDALVDGDEVPAALAPLAVFAQRVQAIGDGPAPAMSAELAVLIATTATSGGEAIELTAARGPRRLPLVAKVAIAGALGTLATAGAAAANVLPDPVNDAVCEMIEAVTPIEFVEKPNEPAPIDPDEHDQPDTTAPTESATTVPGTSTTVASGLPLPTDPTTGPDGNGPGPSSGTAPTAGSPGTTHQGGPPPVTPTHPAPKPQPTTPPATSPPATRPPVTSPPPTEPEKPHPTHPTQPEHPTQSENPTHPEKPEKPDTPEHPASPENSAPESPPGQEKPDKQD